MKNITFGRVARRRTRISSNILGTKECPRISVFRSNRYIYAQAIDDVSRSTVASSSSLGLLKKDEKKGLKKTEIAKQIGIDLAKKLKEKKIEKGIFDRNIYTYLGRVKALAEGLREGGLEI